MASCFHHVLRTESEGLVCRRGRLPCNCSRLCFGRTGDVQEVLSCCAGISNEIFAQGHASKSSINIPRNEPGRLACQISPQRNGSCNPQRHCSVKTTAGRRDLFDRFTQLLNGRIESTGIHFGRTLKFMRDSRGAACCLVRERPYRNQCELRSGASISHTLQAVAGCNRERQTGADRRRDCSPSVPVNFTSLAQPPALAYAIEHTHSPIPLIQKVILPRPFFTRTTR